MWCPFVASNSTTPPSLCPGRRVLAAVDGGAHFAQALPVKGCPPPGAKACAPVEGSRHVGVNACGLQASGARSCWSRGCCSWCACGLGLWLCCTPVASNSTSLPLLQSNWTYRGVGRWGAGLAVCRAHVAGSHGQPCFRRVHRSSAWASSSPAAFRARPTSASLGASGPRLSASSPVRPLCRSQQQQSIALSGLVVWCWVAGIALLFVGSIALCLVGGSE